MCGGEFGQWGKLVLFYTIYATVDVLTLAPHPQQYKRTTNAYDKKRESKCFQECLCNMYLFGKFKRIPVENQQEPSNKVRNSTFI